MRGVFEELVSLPGPRPVPAPALKLQAEREGSQTGPRWFTARFGRVMLMGRV